MAGGAKAVTKSGHLHFSEVEHPEIGGGQLLRWNNESGHYKPTIKQTLDHRLGLLACCLTTCSNHSNLERQAGPRRVRTTRLGPRIQHRNELSLACFRRCWYVFAGSSVVSAKLSQRQQQSLVRHPQVRQREQHETWLRSSPARSNHLEVTTWRLSIQNGIRASRACWPCCASSIPRHGARA